MTTTGQGNKRRGRGPRALAEPVARITQPILGGRGFAEGAIVSDWAAIAGAHLAAHSSPQRIAHRPGSHDGGTLHLRVAAGGLATELQHLEPLLIERINAYFGYRAVARLRILQGPIPERAPPPPPPRPLTTDEEKGLAEHLIEVEDEQLRAALEELGRAVIARRRDKG